MGVQHRLRRHLAKRRHYHVRSCRHSHHVQLPARPWARPTRVNNLRQYDFGQQSSYSGDMGPTLNATYIFTPGGGWGRALSGTTIAGWAHGAGNSFYVGIHASPFAVSVEIAAIAWTGINDNVRLLSTLLRRRDAGANTTLITFPRTIIEGELVVVEYISQTRVRVWASGDLLGSTVNLPNAYGAAIYQDNGVNGVIRGIMIQPV